MTQQDNKKTIYKIYTVFFTCFKKVVRIDIFLYLDILTITTFNL